MNRVTLLLKLARAFRRAWDTKDWNEEEHNRDKGGRFTEKDGATGENPSGTPNRTPSKNKNDGGQAKENGYNEHIAVTAKGRHPFPDVLFVNKQKCNNHFTKHIAEFAEIGIMTMAQYRKETRRIIESPVGGDILGHIASVKNNQIIRYDKRLNLFVKGNPDKGVFTSFIPIEGIGYYIRMEREDLKHDGR